MERYFTFCDKTGEGEGGGQGSAVEGAGGGSPGEYKEGTRMQGQRGGVGETGQDEEGAEEGCSPDLV